MPIKDIKLPPSAPKLRQQRSTLWVDPATASAFRKLTKYAKERPSAMLDKLIVHYIKDHFPELKVVMT